MANFNIILNFQVMPYQQYKDCIEACAACAVACDNCVTSCLGEIHLETLKRCIQLDMECAAICRSAVVLMSLGSTYSSEILEICADIAVPAPTNAKNTPQWEWNIVKNVPKLVANVPLHVKKWQKFNVKPEE
jgi:hypothetical protein